MELEVIRDGKVDESYRRKQARKALYKALRREAANIYDKVYEKAAHGLKTLSTPIILDYLDWKYGTSMRAQYFSGVRTQKILAAKRSYGLI